MLLIGYYVYTIVPKVTVIFDNTNFVIDVGLVFNYRKWSACACMQFSSKESYYHFFCMLNPCTQSVIALQKQSGTPSDNTEYVKALTVNVIIIVIQEGLNVCASTTNISVLNYC